MAFLTVPLQGSDSTQASQRHTIYRMRSSALRALSSDRCFHVRNRAFQYRTNASLPVLSTKRRSLSRTSRDSQCPLTLTCFSVLSRRSQGQREGSAGAGPDAGDPRGAQHNAQGPGLHLPPSGAGRLLPAQVQVRPRYAGCFSHSLLGTENSCWILSFEITWSVCAKSGATATRSRLEGFPRYRALSALVVQRESLASPFLA